MYCLVIPTIFSVSHLAVSFVIFIWLNAICRITAECDDSYDYESTLKAFVVLQLRNYNENINYNWTCVRSFNSKLLMALLRDPSIHYRYGSFRSLCVWSLTAPTSSVAFLNRSVEYVSASERNPWTEFMRSYHQRIHCSSRQRCTYDVMGSFSGRWLCVTELLSSACLSLRLISPATLNHSTWTIENGYSQNASSSWWTADWTQFSSCLYYDLVSYLFVIITISNACWCSELRIRCC